ncbi:hypothetical protein [Streptosporangium sp. NPDC049376]
MHIKPRTTLDDITAIGAELDESELSSVTGGIYPDEVTVVYLPWQRQLD